MNLLVDIGNSRVKWGIGNGENIVSGATLPHDNDQFDQNTLADAWRNLDKPQHIAIASVASETVVDRIGLLAQRLWPGVDIVRARSKAAAYGVCNSYQNPEQLGVDRWLCLLASKRYHTLPVCIVDCGTAVTLDFLDDQGIHLGGMIAPGLSLMKKSLHRETGSLPFHQQNFALGLADNTGAAIYNGTLYAITGLIETVIARQTMLFTLILTGGDAELIAKQLTQDAQIEPDLVLQGLSIFLDG